MDNKRKFNSIIDYIIQENSIIDSGASNVTNKNFYVKKYNRKFGDFNYENASPFVVNSFEHYKNEINYLPILDKYNLTPKLIDYNNDTLILSNCGDVLNKSNIPSNWKEQIYNIYNMLYNENIFHNDFTISNITVLNNKIYLIDFGWASSNKPQYPFFNLTKNIINDSNTIYDIFEKILNNAITLRLSNVNSFTSYINNDCRTQIRNIL